MTIKPEYQTQEEYQNRLKKLNELRSLGVEPFPHKFIPTSTADDLYKDNKDKQIGHSEDAAAGTTPKVTIAGRLVLFRAMETLLLMFKTTPAEFRSCSTETPLKLPDSILKIL